MRLDLISDGRAIIKRKLNGAQGDKQTVKLFRLILSLAIVIGSIATIVSPVSAQESSDSSYGGGSVTAYAAEAPIANGTVVQLAGENAQRVKVATQAQLQNMFGITVDQNQLPLTISGDETVENETFVAVSGTYNALVSTEAGPIAIGDYVTLSAINGIVMKAGTEEETVFGRANAAFDGRGVTLGTMAIKDTGGNTTQTVTLGSIPVTIDIKRNPNEKTTESNLPDFLQRVGQEIAEKEVSPIRIYLSLGITFISIIAAIVMLYAGIRNAVISIGRNPMSKKSIFRALLEVILTAILVLIIGLFAVYLLLRL
jgi:hypothetical protein